MNLRRFFPSAYGGSSAALLLADALLAARQGHLKAAGLMLQRAKSIGRMSMAPRDRQIYAAMARYVGVPSLAPAFKATPADAGERTWVAEMWPELAAFVDG